MLRTLKIALDIDIAYSVNSFIYVLRRLPIFCDLLTEDVYQSKVIKKIISILGLIFSSCRAIFLKFMYFFTIFFMTYKLFPDTMVKSFFHIYFVLTFLGLFINNKLLNTSKKKYFSLLVFNMDATKFFKANMFWNSLTSLLLNTICLFGFGLLLASPIKYIAMLIIYTFFIRFIGETLNILFYKKYNYIWYSNTTIYFIILVGLLGVCALPFFNIFIPLNAMLVATIFCTIFGILSLSYLLKVEDYKLLYKRLSLVTNVMDSKNEKDYLCQAMVEVNKKDHKISAKKLQGKKGYDYFNTIFFERHKEILLRSAKKYSLIAIIIYLILIYLATTNQNYSSSISSFLNNRLGWFVIIIFFINRGAIITQAMFLNCDHAMLTYNFYRERKMILGLFKKRLLTVIKVNLLPATIIGIGNMILLTITTANIISILTTFIFIISLSILFSVHYMVTYYLLQPFNKELEVKKSSYSFVIMFTYFITYTFTDLIIDSVTLSIFGIILTIIYTVSSLLLVSMFAPKTFKLN